MSASEPRRSGKDQPRRAFVELIMGMPISVHVRGPRAGSPAVADAVAEVFAELRRVDAEFSPYRPDSAVCRINRGEARPDRCGPRMAEVVTLCHRARRLTGGYFDAYLPAPGGGRRFDPSGLVKGWAVERAARHLARLAGHDYCLNAGGDVVLGTAEGGTPWRVGIERPDRPRELLTAITRRSGGVATSGSAHRGAHIVDPYTGHRPDRLRSASVVGPSLMWADVYATAAFAHGRDALSWLGGHAGYEALLVCADGLVIGTPGWPRA